MKLLRGPILPAIYTFITAFANTAKLVSVAWMLLKLSLCRGQEGGREEGIGWGWVEEGVNGGGEGDQSDLGRELVRQQQQQQPPNLNPLPGSDPPSPAKVDLRH